MSLKMVDAKISQGKITFNRINLIEYMPLKNYLIESIASMIDF